MAITSHSRSEYRLLALNGQYKQDGPWPGEERNVYPEGNYYAQRQGPILGICLHIADSVNDLFPPDTSAEAVDEYGRTTTRRASWTVCVDSDSICPFLQDHRVAFAQGVTGHNFNTPFLSIEMGRYDTEWRDDPQPWSDDMLRNAAVWAAPRVKEHSIPLVLIRNRDEIDTKVAAGQKVGFCYHGDLDPDNRTDPGIVNGVDTFPIAKFFSFLAEELGRLGTVTKPDRATTMRIQTALDALGYDLGVWGVDGSYGAVTQAAVDSYRDDFGYVQTGYPGSEEIEELVNTVPKIDEVLAAQVQLNAVFGQVIGLLGSISSDLDAFETNVTTDHGDVITKISEVKTLVEQPRTFGLELKERRE